VAPGLEPHELEQLARALADLPHAHAVDAAEEVEVLLPCEVRVEADLLRSQADEPLHPGQIPGEARAQDLRVSLGGREQGREHREGGGLSGAVGAQQAEGLPLADLEGEVANRLHRAEAPEEPRGPHTHPGFRARPLVRRNGARLAAGACLPRREHGPKLTRTPSHVSRTELSGQARAGR
jgi:hypothetical protein